MQEIEMFAIKNGPIMQAFKWALLFLFFLLFPTFLICSYFSLLFHENALLSLLFHSKMSFPHKNTEIFPRSLGYYKWITMLIQEARPLAPQFLMFNLKVSLFWLVLLSQGLGGAFGKFLAWSFIFVTDLQTLSCLVSF